VNSTIHRLNYSKDYYQYRNKFAQTLQTASIPITYYSIDWEKSTYDEKMKAMSFERYGVGELSGMRWKKIKLLPIWGVEQMSPAYNASEEGYLLQDSLVTQIVLPGDFGIRPYPWDFVEFEQKYMFGKFMSGPIFVSTNIEIDTYGEDKYYKVRLKTAPNSFITDIQKQISEFQVFVELYNKVYDHTIGNTMFCLEEKYEKLINKSFSFKNNIGVYLQDR
jgi:hypothetical protein